MAINTMCVCDATMYRLWQVAHTLVSGASAVMTKLYYRNVCIFVYFML